MTAKRDCLPSTKYYKETTISKFYLSSSLKKYPQKYQECRFKKTGPPAAPVYSPPVPPALCVQMDFTWTFEANAKCNNINHV